MQLLLRVIVGIRTRVTGLENLPEGPCIVASKHMSDWDTIALYPLLSNPSFIAKKELFRIPLLGSALKTLNIISIDRKKRGGALKSMLEQGRDRISQGTKLFIFPEGTRKKPLAPPNYRTGASKLYESLDVPLVPVALNSGLFWGRNSIILWPGTASARILPPIAPGLSAEEAHERMSKAIEDATTELILEAVNKGLSSPVSDEFRQRIDQARQKPAIPAQS